MKKIIVKIGLSYYIDVKSFYTEIGKHILYQLSRSGALRFYRILGYRNWNLHYWNMGKQRQNQTIWFLNLTIVG